MKLKKIKEKEDEFGRNPSLQKKEHVEAEADKNEAQRKQEKGTVRGALGTLVVKLV